MKRLILVISAVLILVSGVAMAQSTLNGQPPGPTQQQEPGLTNNNLPNPGNPVPVPDATKPLTENGTVEGTATESMQHDQTGTTTTGTATTTTTTTGTADTTYGTTPTATTTTTTDVNSTDTSVSTTSGDLPKTGSQMPLLALIGLASLGAAFALRAFRG